MLSFFDYLRERVREAVLAGVQDAVEILEHEPFEPKLPSQTEKNATLQPPRPARLSMATGTTTDEKLPPPRKRGPGRPRSNGKAESGGRRKKKP